MIKWYGKSTDGIWKKEIIANDYTELLETMIDMGICDGYWDINSQAYDGLCYYCDKLAILRDEYYIITEEEEDDDDRKAEIFQSKLDNIDWYDDVFNKLTDHQFEMVIRGINAVAYYQEFEKLEK